MSDKSAAVSPIAPPGPLGPNAGSSDPRLTPADFGARLLRGRELRNRRLEEIADTTKVSIQQLRALERGDLNRLPGGIYRRAIVRQYAAAIGLNVEETLRDLASVGGGEVDGGGQTREAVAAIRRDAGTSSFPIALWSSAAALVVLGAVATVATAWYRVNTSTQALPGADARDVELATESAVPQKEPEVVSVAETDATEGELRIVSEPPGALVTVNGIGWGTTPVTIRYMPFGKKLIRAMKPGYVSAQRALDFEPDDGRRSIRIQLSPQSPDTR